MKTYTLKEACELTGLKKFDLSIMTFTKKFVPFIVRGGSGNRNLYSENDIKILKEFSKKKNELKAIKAKLARIALERSTVE